MIRYTLRLILTISPLAMLTPLVALAAYTDAEILGLINHEIENHSIATMGIVALFITGLGGALVWLFFLINDNKRVVLEMEESRHKNHSILVGKIDESYTHVDEKLNKHVLHVANNYTRDDKIERMLERTVKPMQDQLTLMQNTMNDHFSQRARYSDKHDA